MTSLLAILDSLICIFDQNPCAVDEVPRSLEVFVCHFAQFGQMDRPLVV